MIEAQHISYSVGEKHILQDVNLRLSHGEMLAILGPNGAGKSTLLKVLTGTLTPDQGRVQIDGQGIDEYSILQLSKKRAVLSQSAQITFPFSAREIVMMGRSPHLVDRESHDDHRIVDEILYRLDAVDLSTRMFSTLSGGEQQRIQFARVLAQIWDQQGAYLFLDEPTSALDLKQQLNIVELARELSHERGYAVCMIVHDLNLARHYADHVMFLKNGRAVAFGTPEGVLQTRSIADTFDIPDAYAMKFAYT
ncbi:heme ABC transporter ATP-binding protein [Terasakiella pusilla]|jgi:iron complex transport system ATP-binding protein|uniref:heme ABC transporter ATP-binding protein n=1 Tax=Terasakiella pusilla TaxID=64973 RepID=UPI003AA8E715